MRSSLLRYLLWVLLPVGVSSVAAQTLSRGETTSLRVESASRLGNLAVLLFSEEMGARSGELIQEAPILTAPDSRSPLIQAALRGDTVAALGKSEGELFLSVALAEVLEASTEEAGPENQPTSPVSLQVRASTAPAAPNRCPIIDFVELMGTWVAQSPKTVWIARVSVASLRGVLVPWALI